MEKPYNTTDLQPKTQFERHAFHRDMFVHLLRWTYVVKVARIGAKILDFGCGNGNLLEVFWCNKFTPTKYLGLDVREGTVTKAQAKFDAKGLTFHEFKAEDLVNFTADYGTAWDFVCSFEVLEHVGRANVGKFLANMRRHCGPQTQVLLSTPVFDPKVGAAANHIVNGVVGELTREELQAELAPYFEVINVYGTFASQKDYLPHLTPAEREVFDRLKEYYDSTMMSVIFAPMFPQYSRNNLWILRAK